MKKMLALFLFVSISPIRFILPALTPLLLLFVGRCQKREALAFSFIISYTFFVLLLSEEFLLFNHFFVLILLFPIILFLSFYRSFFVRVATEETARIILMFACLLLVNGVVGIVQYLINPGDDSAIGFYGRSGLQMHGLAIMYTFSAVYFYVRSDVKMHNIKALLALFFMLTCFYGAGLVAAFVALFACIIVGTKRKLRSFFVCSGLFVSIIVVGLIVRPGTMAYNYSILSAFFSSIADIATGDSYSGFGMPRKLVSWLNYFEAIRNSPISFLFGFGGGTFNSRAAFLLNGEHSSLSFLPSQMSQWHAIYIKPLWSSHILSQQYQDGTMNQPFSSVLAVLAEFGFIALSCVAFLFNRARLYCLSRIDLDRHGDARRFAVNFMFIYLAILCLFDNMLEYPEIIVPFIIMTPAMTLSNIDRKRSRFFR